MRDKTKAENAWPISKAKANFAAFLRAAEKEPQFITVRGVMKAVIVSKKEADRLRADAAPKAEGP